jgi:hypothetical protein
MPSSVPLPARSEGARIIAAVRLHPTSKATGQNPARERWLSEIVSIRTGSFRRVGREDVGQPGSGPCRLSWAGSWAGRTRLQRRRARYRREPCLPRRPLGGARRRPGRGSTTTACWSSGAGGWGRCGTAGRMSPTGVRQKHTTPAACRRRECATDPASSYGGLGGGGRDGPRRPDAEACSPRRRRAGHRARVISADVLVVLRECPARHHLSMTISCSPFAELTRNDSVRDSTR